MAHHINSICQKLTGDFSIKAVKRLRKTLLKSPCIAPILFLTSSRDRISISVKPEDTKIEDQVIMGAETFKCVASMARILRRNVRRVQEMV